MQNQDFSRVLTFKYACKDLDPGTFVASKHNQGTMAPPSPPLVFSLQKFCFNKMHALRHKNNLSYCLSVPSNVYLPSLIFFLFLNLKPSAMSQRMIINFYSFPTYPPTHIWGKEVLTCNTAWDQNPLRSKKGGGKKKSLQESFIYRSMGDVIFIVFPLCASILGKKKKKKEKLRLNQAKAVGISELVFEKNNGFL